MEYKEPTYEEYCEATKYAKIRYRFGVYIQFIAIILLALLLFYTITNVEEMKSNPAEYAEEKLGVTCMPMLGIGDDNNYGSFGDIKGVE